MDLFSIFVYVCLGFLIFDLGYLLMRRSLKFIDRVMILINGLFCVIISNISIWQAGVYVDTYNLSGNAITFLLNLVNVGIFAGMIFIVVMRTRKNPKE